jgi:hypothetical protein
MRRRVGERVEQEVSEVPAEQLLEPCARRRLLRLRIALSRGGLGD